MTTNELASMIAQREGKKVQVSVGNVREILRILKDLLAEDAVQAAAIKDCLRRRH